MKNAHPRVTSFAMQISIAVAVPFKFLTHLFAVVIDLLINIPVMNAVWRERRELEFLTDDHIKDVGLSADGVRQEIRKSFFDIPHERKRSFRNAGAIRYRKPF